MVRARFDSRGRFMGVDGGEIKKEAKSKQIDLSIHSEKKHKCQICSRPIRHRGYCLPCNLKLKQELSPKPKKFYSGAKSSEKEDSHKRFNNSQDTEYWSLYKKNQRLNPLKFSNGKTQEDVVQEVVNLIKSGKKAIFLHGVCGTGKSAIALNIARILGKTSIVVPIKSLQRQYEKDYMKDMFVLKTNSEKLRISMITGRDNHDSMFKPGVSCADPSLPDNIQITEKNFRKLKELYEENPFINHKNLDNINQLRRISIAPVNPYWSPIVPEKYTLNLPDAKKKTYRGLNGTDFIFYQRKKGCTYYDQYMAYLKSDVIIFNSAKYKIEVAMDRKPVTEVEIIDEADEFLDSFANQNELNLTRLRNSLSRIYPEHDDTVDIIERINTLIKLEIQNKKATGVNENDIFNIKDTGIRKVLGLLLEGGVIESEVSMDDSDSNYVCKALEVAKDFEEFLEDTYLVYREEEDNLYVDLVTTNLSKRLNEIIEKNKAFVFMSGTLHSKKVLEEVFGITDYSLVEAETNHPGTMEINKTGKEFDCSYRTLNSETDSRKNYLEAFDSCIDKAKKPVLIHINAFNDLPDEEEIEQFDLKNLISRSELIDQQKKDKEGKLILEFRKKLFDFLYTTKCSRGIDFPGDSCSSVVFTKYPNPNSQRIFWKVLKKTHPNHFWDFYMDKARREFLQRIYRALRYPNDQVFILSPDLRVLNAVKDLQMKVLNNK